MDNQERLDVLNRKLKAARVFKSQMTALAMFSDVSKSDVNLADKLIERTRQQIRDVEVLTERARVVRVRNCKDCPYLTHTRETGFKLYRPHCSKADRILENKPVKLGLGFVTSQMDGIIPEWCPLEVERLSCD